MESVDLKSYVSRAMIFDPIAACIVISNICLPDFISDYY